MLHIITGLYTGGAERALYNLLAGGLAKPERVAVLSLCDEGAFGPRIRALGVSVYSLGMQRGVPGPMAISRLRKVVRANRPDLIQGWMYHGNLAASLAGALAFGRPVVAWNVRQSLYSLKSEKLLTRQVIRGNRWLSGGVDALVYNSQLSRQQHEAFGLSGKRARVIPNGFDLDALRPDSQRRRTVRQALGLPEEILVVGHVARFHPMKDHASFLRAAVEVARQRAGIHFLLAGRGVGPQTPALAGIVPPDLMGRFHFIGERDDVHEVMQAMDLFSTSSAWGEGFPNVLGEAMASGLPCLATDVGDSRDIVGETGEIVSPSNPTALTKGLLALLDRTAEERRALGRAARARIEGRYALSRVVERYQTLYEELTSR